MTSDELKTELEKVFPTALEMWKKPPAYPYLAIAFAYSGDLYADDKNYKDIGVNQVELYTAKKDLQSEALVQAKLKELGIPYSKIGTYLDDARMYQMIYEIRLI
ncbi:hypothetical protein KM799_14170 [Clostridium tyrobutyricum]|uniref:hypothetical protein n=1 Tax=Clostridium tyrobutyricum TaxID=1519 RepID=UPI001C395B14|nr:hypothetical protein [Clostridium tyrobutyricum]MBV4447746.1 hypothetical protein [Clostridium tyrobutyricum]